MLTDLARKKLRNRVDDYVSRVPVSELDIDAPASIVRAPISVGAGNRFISVDNIPDLRDLPFIPERMRDFAFRYATEYMPLTKWAQEYNCSTGRVSKWLSHEGVRAYIAVCRYEQRMYNLAQHVTMQKNVYRSINKILNTKLTGETIGPIVSLTKFVYQILHDPQGAGDRAKGVFNLQIGFGQTDNSSVSDSPYASDGNPYRVPTRDVTPKQIAALEADIEELDILAKVLAKRHGNGGE